MKKILNGESKGSYVIVKPIEKDDLWKGEIFRDNSNKGVSEGDIIFYLDEDCHKITIDGLELHVILYYHIVLYEYIEPLYEDYKNKASCFVGMKI